jgi:hypothetical protein
MLENGPPVMDVRFVASEMNATKRPSSLIAGEVLSALPASPVAEIDTMLETLTLLDPMT